DRSTSRPGRRLKAPSGAAASIVHSCIGASSRPAGPFRARFCGRGWHPGSYLAYLPTAVPKRILFVEHSETGLVGGSLTGLLPLIRGLDRQAYTSTLLLYEPKDLDGELDETGCRVVVLPHAQSNGRAPTRTPDTRSGRVAETRRALGAVRRFVRQVLPKARTLLPLLKAERPDL